MWYKKAISLEQIDAISDLIKSKKNYDPEEHLKLISDLAPARNSNSNSVEDAFISFYDAGEPHRVYHSIHPQIYIYPSEGHNEWRYLLFDPKDLKRLENDDYKENLSTYLPLDTPIQEVFNYLHQFYPTATLDYFETEEEMLEQE